MIEELISEQRSLIGAELLKARRRAEIRRAIAIAIGFNLVGMLAAIAYTSHLMEWWWK